MRAISTNQDKELLSCIAEDDQKAFNLLFERYRNRLFSYLQTVTKSNQAAEEIVLDVFLKIWTGRSILSEIDNFEAFLFRVARNKAIDFLRSVKKSRARQSELWEHLQKMAATETADHAMLLAESQTTVQRAIDQLSPQRKAVFQLSREHGLTYEQIGRRLHLSTHTVRNHLSASLQFIRAHLKTEMNWILLISIFFPLH